MSRCVPRVRGARAREMQSLSAAPRKGKVKNDGAVCSGAGSKEDFITEMRPPGSMKFI